MIASNSHSFRLTLRQKTNQNVSIARMITVFAIVKGAVIATVTAAIGITFFQSLIIAVVSSVIGAAGATLAAVIAVHATRSNRDLLHDIQRNTETAKRETDPPAESE